MQPQMPKGLFFVLVAPGGAGKNVLMDSIIERHPQIKQLATATTREIRPGEQQGREHLFVSPTRFREMVARDELLEHQEVTTDRFYGIPRASVEDSIKSGQHLIADIEVKGAKIVHDAYPNDVVVIFVDVPGNTIEEKLKVLRQRMEQRTDGRVTKEEKALIEARLKRARELEFPFANERAYVDYIIINDEKVRAVRELDEIIREQLTQRMATTTTEEA